MSVWDERTLYWAQKKPNARALGDENLSFTFQELEAVTAKLSAALHSVGISPGDRVVVQLARTSLSAAILISLLRRQIVGLVIDLKTPAREMEKILATIQPRAVIASMLPPGGRDYSANPLPVRSAFVQPQLFLFKESKVESSHKLRWLLHTSGSTGAPKAVMLSEENLLDRSASEVADFDLSDTSRVLNALPFTHDLGLNQILTTLQSGAELDIKSLSLPPLARHLQDRDFSGLTATPLLWIDFLKGLRGEIFPNIRYLTISGGQLQIARIEDLIRTFPNARIFKTYGQTETFRTFINDEPRSKHLGRAVRGVTVETTPDNELIHYGKTSMLGYLFDPVLSAERLCEKEGFGVGVRTLDSVDRTPDMGYVFAGRRDDVIKRFEQRFHLSEIEDTLRQSPDVLEVIVVTVPSLKDEWRQSDVGAFVLLKPGASLTSERLFERCRAELSYYKVPDKIVVVADYPRTSSYKVDRQALSALLKKELS